MSAQLAVTTRAAVGVMLMSCVLSACQPDVVGAGYYADLDAGPARTTPRGEAGTLGGGAGTGAFTGVGTAGTQAGMAGVGSMPGGTAGVDMAAAGGGGEDSEVDPACDMRGRWIITHHVVVDGLGQLQTSHSWKYFELAQQGETLTVTKGLHCGDDVVARTALAASADMHSSWPGAMTHTPYAGLTGTSHKSAAGCDVSFQRHYSVLGATMPYYLDPAHPLPKLEEPANGSTPGWEDWENDGEPGITIVLSGGITGRRFMVSRNWHDVSGTVANTQGLLKLKDDWGQNEAALKIDGSPLLFQTGVKAADATLHFVEMARLDDGQANGDDAAICTAIRTLAKTLTPNAAKN